MKFNYKSDFDFILPLLLENENGVLEDVGFPEDDFVVSFYTNNPTQRYVISKRFGELQNCVNDNGKIRAIFANHNLLLGRLTAEAAIFVKNDIYPIGYKRIAVPKLLDIELVSGPGNEGDIEAISIEVAQAKQALYETLLEKGYELQECLSYKEVVSLVASLLPEYKEESAEDNLSNETTEDSEKEDTGVDNTKEPSESTESYDKSEDTTTLSE